MIRTYWKKLFETKMYLYQCLMSCQYPPHATYLNDCATILLLCRFFIYKKIFKNTIIIRSAITTACSVVRKSRREHVQLVDFS